MNLKSNTFWVESKDKNGKVQIVGHSQDKKTGEIYHLHVSRSSANKLLKAEQKVSPEYRYRVVREVKQLFAPEF